MTVIRLFLAALPVFFALLAMGVYAQTSEERLRMVEMNVTRQEERYHAIVARIDAIDKTLWWLVVSTLTSGGVSGAVAADRALYRKRGT